MPAFSLDVSSIQGEDRKCNSAETDPAGPDLRSYEGSAGMECTQKLACLLASQHLAEPLPRRIEL